MPDGSSTWTAIAFWAGLAAVVCTWIITAAARRKTALATIQAAIERGQPLDARTVALLLGKESRAKQQRDLRIQGSVWLALGAGFAVWGLIGFGHPHMVIIGLGAVLASVGAGLFLAVRVGFGSGAASDDDGEA